MVTISLCMIVKNEENVLGRCLESLKGLIDEWIIVDTGSTDRTKEIAKEYGATVYDFAWIDDFAAARNFAFSKATMDYIYSADADEVLDEENRQQFLLVKENMLPEIEIVQMHYRNVTGHNTTENFEDEYRPKLYKRLRTFTWINPVHEAVNLIPVVYDSDITILHMPENAHGKRDFRIFRKTVATGEMTYFLTHMYARELMLAGDVQDFSDAEEFFLALYEKEPECTEDVDAYHEAACILARYYRLAAKKERFLEIAVKEAEEGIAEAARELGLYYESSGLEEEAAKWYKKAAESEAIIDATATEY